MDEDRKKLKKIYKQLKKEEDTVKKKWYQSLFPNAILLFPVVAFCFTFLKVNTDKSILDLLSFVAVGGLLVLGGIFWVIAYRKQDNVIIYSLGYFKY